MPLFSRSDGTLVRDLAPVRYIMPYLMRGRNESIVYHQMLFDLTRTRGWLEQFNAKRQRRATLFHLILYAVARTLHERPGLNRFISGNRIYQRNGVFLSFAAKAAFEDSAPLITVKLELPKDEPFESLVDRITERVGRAKTTRTAGGTVDQELKLAMALPGFVLRAVLALMQFLDRVNLLPGSLIANDPMYASAFLGNLGSIGIGDTYHHLYEYGTVSLFGVVGKAEKTLMIGDDGQPVVRDAVQLCWSFDERINDGFYCASSLRVAQKIVEDPAKLIGDP
jgi:pyruvate/2-oxoglutarate dehydrogenase complex dihydrolipoamide acyltransferase (E2) component